MSENSQLWVEKYRPKKITDIAHQEEVVSTLRKAVEESAGKGDLPHLLFYGPPGTGKTSTALALTRDLFGPQHFRSRVLELNASDERGIKVVREKIKTFAQSTVSNINNTKGKDGTTHPCPPFKIIILDEADAITRDAQTALRRTMEAHSRVTRFILICNYISRVIGPITSRCAKFRFNSLPISSMISHLRKIADTEKVNIDNYTLNVLISSADGDMRKAINTLQSTNRVQVGNNTVTGEAIATAACLVPTDVIDSFDKTCSDTAATNTILRRNVDDIVSQGFPVSQLLAQYGDRIFENDADGVGKMNDLQKSAVAIIVAEAEKAILDGCDEQIQLYNVVSRISNIASAGDNLKRIIAS